MADKDIDPMLRKHPDFEKVNDKDHAVLYKSPGPHRGSKGRTYDFVQAKSKEQAEALIEEGWSETDEEAYALATELKKGRKSKRTASDEDEDEEADEADPITGTPTPAPKKPKKKAK